MYGALLSGKTFVHAALVLNGQVSEQSSTSKNQTATQRFQCLASAGGSCQRQMLERLSGHLARGQWKGAEDLLHALHLFPCLFMMRVLSAPCPAGCVLLRSADAGMKAYGPFDGLFQYVCWNCRQKNSVGFVVQHSGFGSGVVKR